METDVGLTIDEDGTGSLSVAVELDAEAARRAGNLRQEIRTADLEAAGWRVEGPSPVDGGGQRLVVTRPFTTTAEAEGAFRSLATEEGPFGRTRIRQSRGIWATQTTFESTVDLRGSLAAFGDPALTEALEGQPLGVPLETLEQRLGASLDRLFSLEVATRLPGSVESNAPQRFDGGAKWSPRLGEQVVLRASSTSWHRMRIALSAVAALSALGAVGLGATWAARRRKAVSSDH